METVLPITSGFTALAAVALVALSMPVSLKRMKVGADTGDGGDQGLHRRIRAQGNFIEYAPLGLLAVALVEMSGPAGWVVWTLGGLLAVGRALHAAGMLRGSTPLRAGGMILTYLSLLGSAGLLALAALT